MQANPGANIWDIINLINSRNIKVNYDILIVHVGTNHVGRYEVADFDIAYNVLISTLKRLTKPNAIIIMSAMLPRPVDFQDTGYFVASVNSRLRTICFKRGVKFVATYKPFLSYGVPIDRLFSPMCKLHLNHFGNQKLTNFYVQVLAHC